jgi:hypothetical protein
MKSLSTKNDFSSLLASLPPEHNQAILAALAAIDGGDSSNASSNSTDKGKSRENPQLLNAIAHLLHLSGSATKPAPSSTHVQVKTQIDDDEIVLLDKENVNPGAFKRSSSFFKSDDLTDAATPEATSVPTNAPPPTPVPSSSVSTSAPLTPRRFKRSYSLVEAEAAASLLAPTPSTSTQVSPKKPLSPKKVTPTKNQGLALSSIYTRFVQSSPIMPSNVNFHPIPGSSCPRPSRPQGNTAPTTTTKTSTIASSSSGATFTFRTMSVPANTNASASTSTIPNIVPSTKRSVYKVPEWAKTGTAMKPRMAEWVVAKAREEEEAATSKRVQRKEEAKKEKQLREKETRKRRRQSTSSGTVGNLAPPPLPPITIHPPSTPPRRRISTDFQPALPSDDNSFAFFRSPTAKTSERNPASTPRTKGVPVTPPPRTPRRRSSGMSSGGTRIGSSLFTPKTPTPRITSNTAKARFPSGSNNNSKKKDKQRRGADHDLDNIFASPSPAIRHRATASNLSHEPETPSKRGRISLQARILNSKSICSSLHAASIAAAAVLSSDELDGDGAETEEEPSSSLPFLTSDAAFNESAGTAHWSVGLPPSSPPPVSSPSLTPSRLESEAELEMMLDPALDTKADVDTDTDGVGAATPATTTSTADSYTAENTPVSDHDSVGSENVLDSSPTSVGGGEDTSATEDDGSEPSSSQQQRQEQEEAALDLAAFSDLFATQSSTSSLAVDGERAEVDLDCTKGFSASAQVPDASDTSTLTLTSCDFDFSFALPSTSAPVDPTNVISDFDFTQFWASVGPLDGLSASTTTTMTGAFGGEARDGDSPEEHNDSQVRSTPTEVDAVKFAEQMQKLFSGCLM